METESVYDDIYKHIKNLKESMETLEQSGREVPAIRCNLTRIKASVKMLELNISDILEISENDMTS